MALAPHVVIVDDEEEIRAMVAEYLSAHGLTTSTAADGEELRAILARGPVDLVLLDVTMPGEDGLSIGRRLRDHVSCGIIFLTGAAGVVDRVAGLELGADDYITKPFDPRELLARVRSVLRRLKVGAASSIAAATTTTDRPRRVVRFGACCLDLDARRLANGQGEDIPITAMEFDLLEAFAERPNRVLSRDQLLDLAHGKDWEPFDRSIDIRIARLRRKIEIDPGKPRAIRTVRGLGYMFVPSPITEATR